MKELRNVMSSMIRISEQELDLFMQRTNTRTFKKYELLAYPDRIPQEVFFIVKGLVRVLITDQSGTDHTIHFALENQFIADYSNFIVKEPSIYALQALEETEVVVLPREAIEWGYEHLGEGQKMGRLIAEYYFIYQDNRIKNLYTRTPKERYDCLSGIFPNIHNRVPQYLLASYLGITPIHLSRLKKSSLNKL